MRIRICPECEHRMSDAASAMRRHGSQMDAAVQFAQTELSEEERKQLGARLTASFNEAQAAWDAYRQHLIQHGFDIR